MISMFFFVCVKGLRGPSSQAHSIGTQTMSSVVPIQKQLGASSQLIRIAALSGAAAVCLAAYGRHHMKDTAETKEYRSIYESANNMHLIHSVALLATPLAKRPLIVNNSYFNSRFYRNFFCIKFVWFQSALFKSIAFRLDHCSSLAYYCLAAPVITKRSKSQKANRWNIFQHIWHHMVVSVWSLVGSAYYFKVDNIFDFYQKKK